MFSGNKSGILFICSQMGNLSERVIRLLRSCFIRIALFKIVFITLSVTPVVAQDVQFSGSAPPVVAVGEQFRLTYSLNTSGSDLRLPDLGNFRLVSGPGTSTSSSVQIINGQMTQTQSVTFTYILVATEVGKHRIGPASINTDSGRQSSNAIEIEVVADSQGRSSVPGQQAPGTTPPPSEASGNELFVRVLTDKREVYQGEAVTVTIKLYSKLDLTGIENVRFPSFSAFYQQEIETPPLRNLDREVINGEIYNTGVLKRVLLFPQRIGEINIDPFEMDALVRQRTARRGGSMFDDFFGAFETRRIPVKSPPVTIKVNPLPGQRPPSFDGAVGNLKLGTEISHTETNANEPVTLNVTISGTGNLKLLSRPRIDFPPAFEVYDPGIRENITNRPGGQEGSISYEYLMIPRSEGNFRIPPVQFSFFDPSGGTYRTADTEEFMLVVHSSDESEGRYSGTGFSREDLRIIGSDIRFISTVTILRKVGDDPFASIGFYLWFIVPLALFFIIIFLQRKNIRERSDIALMKNRRAGRMARRRLKAAGKHIRDNDPHRFFEEILRAQWGYLSDKLLIPVAELNRENAIDGLLARNVPEEDAARFMDILSECEFSRYSQSKALTDMDRIYRDTKQLFTIIEQKIRK